MNHDYTFLGLISLDAGSWANWFAGTMSAAAVATALSAQVLARRAKTKEDRKREVEAGRSIGWKLLKVLNHTGDIDRHFKTSLARRAVTSPPGMKFPLVQPLGVPDRPLQELNQNETDLLLKSNSAELLAEIDMCMGRYYSIIYAMGEYKARHEALYELMPRPVEQQGTLFTHVLLPEQNERVRPYMSMLETLLGGIIALTEENVKRATAALALYAKDMERHFGKPLMDIEAIPDADQVEEDG